jgi:hypothetical protein
MNLLQRLACAVAVALLEATTIFLGAGSVLGFTIERWTTAELAFVGIAATLASIAVAHAIVFRTPRPTHSSSAHETASRRVFKGVAAP